MYLLREEANVSLPRIGEFLGGRDHTTVIYGCEKIASLLQEDDRLRKQVLEIREKLYGPGVLNGSKIVQLKSSSPVNRSGPLL
jgi:hypothetical protein